MNLFNVGDLVRQRFSDQPMRVTHVWEIPPANPGGPPKYEVDCEWEQGGATHRATFATLSELRLVPPAPPAETAPLETPQ